MNDITPLDSILSGRGEAMPQPEVKDEKIETQATETVEQTEPEAAAAEPEQQDGEPGKLPVGKIRQAEREKAAKRYTEQVADFERKLDDQNQAWERRFTQLVQNLRPQQPPQEPQQPPDFFADPDAAVQHALRPVLQQLGAMTELTSRQFAVRDHGLDAVNAAYDAMDKRFVSDPSVRSEYQRIMNSGDPWGELCKWHKRDRAMAEIGNDPDKYREKLKAELLAELQQGNGQQQQAQEAPAAASVLPSNFATNFATARNTAPRSGPPWSGPASINDIFDRRKPAR